LVRSFYSNSWCMVS